jgi:hypothetical protein
VAGKTRFACVDGPEFDGADVDFKNLVSRLRAYKAMEDESRELYAAHRHACEERARAEAASGSQP